ncbi:MAG: DUF2059 domain-containing protein [Gammaproteobacteria bacterium]|nr:DUF2059 domain-containing protein [Gammaproteobacteria bacterium]
MLCKFTLLLYFILMTSNAHADDVTHRQTAEELLVTSKADEIVNTMYDQIQTIFINMADKMNMPSERKSITEKYMQRLNQLMLNEYWPGMKDQLINVYIALYTEEEMSELIAFYKSPIGQKYINTTPKLMRESLEISQNQMKDLMPKIRSLSQEMAAELKAVN